MKAMHWILLILVGCLIVGCLWIVDSIQRREPTKLTGSAMGTSWMTIINHRLSLEDRERIKIQMDEELSRLDQIFSTWDLESELSYWNRSQSVQAQPVSPELAEVVALALEIGRASEGFFDPTLLKLVDHWGFGPQSSQGEWVAPSEEEISKAREATGGEGVEFTVNPPQLRKLHPGVQLDLSGIAKGYALEKLADLLEKRGERDFMIELGGEVVGRGERGNVKGWPVGVAHPYAPDTGDPAKKVILLNEAMATSGTYYQQRVFHERTTSHILDPRTGKPPEHNTVSVSVIHEDAAVADAWATALLAAGREEGQALAERNGIVALFLERPQSPPNN